MGEEFGLMKPITRVQGFVLLCPIKTEKSDHVVKFQLINLEQVGSSNDIALEAARSGAADGLVVWAQQQSKGRGQRNHTWESQPKSSLTFSVLFRPNQEELTLLGRFTALGALAVGRAVQAKLVERHR